MLIPLPITCAIGALVADIVALATGYPGWTFMGYVLTVGMWATGLLAALPGLLDYLFVVPSRSAAKLDATIHMTLNVTIVVLYFISWLAKNAVGGAQAGPPISSLVLEIIGSLLLGVSGWYGWTLVYKHRVGIDDRAKPSEVRKFDRRIA